MFENQTRVNAAKDFDQSKEKEIGILEVPLAYQEFDEIEHEIKIGENSLSEVTSFAEQFNDAKVVRRDDVIALESLVGKLENLPHLNSYTLDYSLVNYQITQENIFVAVGEMAVKVLRAIWKFIVNAFETSRKFIFELFNKDYYASDIETQDNIVKTIDVTTKAVVGSKDTVDAKTAKLTDEQIKIRIVRINKDLRALLYTKSRFTEIGVLSRGGDINVDALIDEMCEQRLKPFYTAFIRAAYEKDDDLRNLIKTYLNTIATELEVLNLRTTEIFEGDLSQPPANKYDRRFTKVPDEVTAFITKFGQLSVAPDRIHNPDDQYKVFATEAYHVSVAAATIANTYDLPEPRTILKLPVEWMGELFTDPSLDITQSLKLQFATVKNSYKSIRIDINNIHPEAKNAVNAVYADWITINRMIMTLGVIRTRISAIMKNMELMAVISNKAVAIINS